MKRIAAVILLISVVSGLYAAPGNIPRATIRPDNLMIPVPAGSSREFAYTNKEAGVYYSETNGPSRSSWQGWRIMAVEMLEGYRVMIEGSFLDPSTADAEVYPDRLVRKYPDGSMETVTLLDSIDAVLIQLDHCSGTSGAIRPYFSESRDPSAYSDTSDGGVLLIAHRRHLARTEQENYPVWVGVTAAAGGEGCAKLPDTSGTSFSPGVCRFAITGGRAVLLIVAGDTPGETAGLAGATSKDFKRRTVERAQRMEDLLNRSYVRTSNPRFDKAVQWAMLSADALIMNQRGKGIFAGLPWFDNYWGRDSFIALAGAVIATGDYADAKAILRSFSHWQETDSTNSSYGRIPNFVSTTSIAYNTADGTPRYVAALERYIRASGDTAFAREMYPVVKRSIEGTLRYHTDSLGFLTHGDADSWMDAAGPDGAWSPRGNRANDVQELWWEQLSAGSRLALMLSDETAAARWKGFGDVLAGHFRKYFIDDATGAIYDHLNADGTPGLQMRPNEFFACRMPGAALTDGRYDSLTETLVYPYGVASLSQNDENFHPFHHYAPYYVQDAAYHNGIVWTWLAGAWIDETVRRGYPDLAWNVTANMVHQVLDRGAVGTMSELLDAVPRPGEAEPRLSGTYSQAWSLGEFLRSLYDAYAGIRIDAPGRQFSVRPALPDSVGDATLTFLSGRLEVTVLIRRIENGWEVSCSTPGMQRPVVKTLEPFQTLVFRYSDAGLLPGGEAVLAADPGARDAGWPPHLATPYIRPGLKAFAGPGHRLLTNSDVMQKLNRAVSVCTLSDPAGDDTGTGHYRYPSTPYLKPGSLDIIGMSVDADDRNCRFRLQFRALSDPGWHPEYGFQLTFAAIAIDTGGRVGSHEAKKNSGYIFPQDFGFQRIIYVGGGVQVVTDRDSILAEYIPSPGDEQHPLGNAAAGTIAFTLPLELLGKPDTTWRFSVLVGCQDDHGGAGIGEFRAVGAEVREWSGGGKIHPTDPNVYDVLLPPAKR